MTTALNRTTSRTVTFTHPITLNSVDGLQPAGSYVVDTDEDLVDSLSFPVYRRMATWLHLPRSDGGPNGGTNMGMTMSQTALIDPDELDRILQSGEKGS